MKITLDELRPILELMEGHIAVLSDDELLRSSLHRDLGLDTLYDFNMLAGAIVMVLHIKKYPPAKEMLKFVEPEYDELTVQEYLDELNRIFAECF